jgi:hypothetical protein
MERCEDRPAFCKALADQMAPFAAVHAQTGTAPPSQ